MAIKTIPTCRKNKQIQSGNDLVVDKIRNSLPQTHFYLPYTVRNLVGPKKLFSRSETADQELRDLFSKIINFDAAGIFLLCQHFTGANRRMFFHFNFSSPK